MRADLELVLAHEPCVHQVLQVGKAFLHPEADRPHGHAVGQQHVPAHAHPKWVKSYKMAIKCKWGRGSQRILWFG